MLQVRPGRRYAACGGGTAVSARCEDLDEKRDDVAAVHEGLHFLVGGPLGGSCCGVEDERQEVDIGSRVEEKAWAPEHP